MTKLEELKTKMDAISKKWSGVYVKEGSFEDALRSLDRAKYRYLKDKYNSEIILNGGVKDQIAMAEEIFGTRATPS